MNLMKLCKTKEVKFHPKQKIFLQLKIELKRCQLLVAAKLLIG